MTRELARSLMGEMTSWVVVFMTTDSSTWKAVAIPFEKRALHN